MSRALALTVLIGLAGCADAPPAGPYAVLIAGERFPTAAPVILWNDPGGYDGYAEHRHFQPEMVLPSKPGAGCDTPKRYGARTFPATAAEPPSLGDLREKIDQFVIHFDVCRSSRQCFNVLHDVRGLSVHFLLDLDGTVYQTIDLLERARHATIANDRSIGIEIAQMGAYRNASSLDAFYIRDVDGGLAFKPSLENEDLGLRTPGFIARPAREALFEGTINGSHLFQYDFTPEQYASLIELTRTLCQALPRLRPTVPRDERGAVIDRVLTAGEFAAYSGLLGHWHVQKNKSDPGPAFDWDRLLLGLAGTP